jgi:hypothetical protein
MTARPTYLAPAYVEVSEHTYEEYREITRRHGEVERISRPLPTALTDGLCFRAGSVGYVPDAGDEIGVGATDRLDVFTAGGRYFVLAES